MNTQKLELSAKEHDTSNYYVVLGILSLALGGVCLYLTGDKDFNSISRVEMFAAFGAFLLLGLFLIGHSSRMADYLYKVEIAENTLYISKTEFLLTTKGEQTIEVPTTEVVYIMKAYYDLLTERDKDKLRTYYLILKTDTPFGRKIPFFIAAHETKESLEEKILGLPQNDFYKPWLASKPSSFMA